MAGRRKKRDEAEAQQEHKGHKVHSSSVQQRREQPRIRRQRVARRRSR